MLRKVHPPSPEYQQAYACPECEDTGRVVIVGPGDTPEEDLTLIWPCPACKVTSTDLPSVLSPRPIQRGKERRCL